MSVIKKWMFNVLCSLMSSEKRYSIHIFYGFYLGNFKHWSSCNKHYICLQFCAGHNLWVSLCDSTSRALRKCLHDKYILFIPNWKLLNHKVKPISHLLYSLRNTHIHTNRLTNCIGRDFDNTENKDVARVLNSYLYEAKFHAEIDSK